MNLIHTTIISTTVGKNSLEDWTNPHSQQKSPKWVFGCSLKNDRMTSVRFQDKPFSITVIQVYALTRNAEKAEAEQ